MRPMAAPEPREPLTITGTAAAVGAVKGESRRLIRLAPEVISELPDERLVRIDVNGCLAGTVHAFPDAPRELAVGWAFMHGFFDLGSELDRVTVDGDRVSIMVETGEDIDRRRLEAVGWAEPSPMSSPESGDAEPFCIEEACLIDLIDAAWREFRGDGGAEGFLHAAMASSQGILCIARDRTIDTAAAKIFGWSLLDGQEVDAGVLMMRGIVGRRTVETAARRGVSLIVTSAIPTSEAFRAALGLSMSLVGMAASRTVGLLVDGGHIASDLPA